MTIPLTFAKLLARLSNQEMINIGWFNKSEQNQLLLHQFIEEKVLFAKPTGKTKIIYCPNIDYLNNYLREQHGITDLQKFISLSETDYKSRSDSTAIVSNSKAFNSRVFDGFFIKAYLDIYGTIDNRPILLKPIPGSWIYISDYKSFKIGADITIVGVENVETFKNIEAYRRYFHTIKPLFLLRYNNNAYIEWLQSIPNPYLHFGDLDLSGIALFILEYVNKLGTNRCKFFVPDNYIDLIKQSKNSDNYLKQLNDHRIKSIDLSQFPELRDLVEAIHKYQRTVEQEALKIEG